MKRLLSLMLTLLLTAGLLLPCAKAEDTVLEPLWHVPDYVQWLLDVARGEIGYKEGPHGYSKYGEWAGDAYAQWCAEFLCWCVDQVDQQHGTELLRNVYPMYSGQNVGRDWFIRQGRYVTRNGNLANWGYQWMKDDDTYITTGRTSRSPATGCSSLGRAARTPTTSPWWNTAHRTQWGTSPCMSSRETHPLRLSARSTP